MRIQQQFFQNSLWCAIRNFTFGKELGNNRIVSLLIVALSLQAHQGLLNEWERSKLPNTTCHVDKRRGRKLCDEPQTNAAECSLGKHCFLHLSLIQGFFFLLAPTDQPVLWLCATQVWVAPVSWLSQNLRHCFSSWHLISKISKVLQLRGAMYVLQCQNLKMNP